MIDTWVKVKPGKSKDQPEYAAGYESLRELNELCDEHQMAIVLVHHQRKMGAK